MCEQFDVVIIGGLHHNTLGVIRALGEKGVSKDRLSVLIVGSNVEMPNIISRSRYVRNDRVTYLSGNDEVAGWLTANACKDEKRVVICCSDGSAEAVIASHDVLEQWYEIPSVSVDIELLLEKQKQGDIAIECGLTVPRSAVFRKGDTLDWQSFPCISKPAKSVIGGGKSDIVISKDPEALRDAMDSAQSEYIQVQEYIRKKMEFQLIGCSIKDGDEIIIPGYTEIIRQPDNTNTGYLRYSPIGGLSYDAEAVSRFIRRIGYNGLFSMEFVRDEKGTDYFLEMNFRNDGNAYCVTTAGVNLPYIWCYYKKYGRLPQGEALEFSKPLYFIPDYADMKRGFQIVGKAAWIREFLGAKSHAVFNWKDMGPFMNQTAQVFRQHFFK